MAGRLILDACNPALLANGLPDAGATLEFFLNGTTTPQNVYTTPACNVALDNPLSPDASGRFPQIWAPRTNEYSVKWTPTGVSPITFDDIFPLSGIDALSFATKTDAEAASIPADVDFITLSGYAAVGDAQEMLIYKRSALAPSGHELYFQSDDGAYWEYQPGPAGISFAACGALASTTNCYAAWNRAKAYAATYSEATVKLIPLNVPAGIQYDFTQGIIADISVMPVRGNGALFKFTLTSGNNAITFQNSNPLDGSNYTNARSVFEGLLVLGAGVSDTAGFYFAPTGGDSVAHFLMRNCCVYGFARGIELNANAYLCTFESVDSFQNTTGLIDNGNQSNAGERITFINCNFFNNVGQAIDLSNNIADYKFIGCSIDYNCTGALTTPQITIMGTRASFVACHIEGGSVASSPVGLLIGKSASLDSAYVSISGGSTLLQVVDSGAVPYIEVEDGGILNLGQGDAVVDNSTTTALKVHAGGTCRRFGFEFTTSAAITTDVGSTYGNYAGTVVT